MEVFLCHFSYYHQWQVIFNLRPILLEGSKHKYLQPTKKLNIYMSKCMLIDFYLLKLYKFKLKLNTWEWDIMYNFTVNSLVECNFFIIRREYCLYFDKCKWNKDTAWEKPNFYFVYKVVAKYTRNCVNCIVTITGLPTLSIICILNKNVFDERNN